MKRIIALLACSLIAAVGFVSAAPASEAALPSPITITCFPGGCVGNGQLGPIVIHTISTGGFTNVLACLSDGHGGCSPLGGRLYFDHQNIYVEGVAGAAAGYVLLNLRYVAGFLGVPGLAIALAGNNTGTVVALLTPHLQKCVVYNGTGIHLVNC